MCLISLLLTGTGERLDEYFGIVLANRTAAEFPYPKLCAPLLETSAQRPFTGFWSKSETRPEP